MSGHAGCRRDHHAKRDQNEAREPAEKHRAAGDVSGRKRIVLYNMRLFIAIKLSDELKTALISTRNAMYDRGVRGSYSPEENLHLTLAFIGEYPDAEAVMDALTAVTFAPFTLSLDGIGRFGDLWWAGVKDSASLTAAARRVRRALAENGIPFDRKRFLPHITLIRRAMREAAGIRVAPLSMTVNSISLMRSDRGRNGMIYTELGSVEASSA